MPNTLLKFPSIGNSHIGRNVVTKPEAQNTFLALHKQRQQQRRRRRLRRHGTGLWVENRKADKTKTGRTGKSGRNVKKWTEEHTNRGREEHKERERKEEATVEEATAKRVLPTQQQQQQLLCCPASPLPTPHLTPSTGTPPGAGHRNMAIKQKRAKPTQMQHAKESASMQESVCVCVCGEYTLWW